VTPLRLNWGAATLLCFASLGGQACTQVEFTNPLQILVAPEQYPLAGASSLEITLRYPEGEPVIGLLTVAQGTQEVPGLRPGNGVTIEVVARDSGGNPVSLGRSGPIDIGEDGTGAAVFLGEADSVARIPDALTEARAFATLLALPDERFVVVGGGNSAGKTPISPELFGSHPTAPLSSDLLDPLERIGHQTLYMPSEADQDNENWGGQIVVIGGTTGSADDTWTGAESDASDSVVLLNPTTGEVTTGVSYFDGGILGASAVRTPEGLIAVVAGIDDDNGYRETVEVLVPGETFPITGPQITGRVMQQLTPLEVAGTPQFFLSGGWGEEGLVASVERWDGRQTSEFSSQIGMVLEVPRARHQATALADGLLFISGGAKDLTSREDHGLSVSSAELIDTESGEVWTVDDSLGVPRQRHVAAAIPGNRVLLCAGVDSSGTSLGSCEVFDVTTETFSGFSAGSMSPGGPGVSSAALPDGRILFSGGSDGSGADNSLYIYTPPDWQD